MHGTLLGSRLYRISEHGDKIFVDYTVTKARIVDRENGEIHRGGTVPRRAWPSSYTVGKVTWTVADWIG